MTTLLDLSDSKICLWHNDLAVLSPGYVSFNGAGYSFGLTAQETSRRTPKAVNTRFWSQLSTQPLAPPLGPARHTADLVHQHLEALHASAQAPATCLVAVPATMSREQLSLLLGIVQHLPFEIEGLIHRTALLASMSGLSRGQHVELQLHQTVVTAFEEHSGTAYARETQTLPGQGLLALQDALATRISDIFVHQTRFDPLRSADNEQALYDALPALLAALKASGESRLTLSGYDARITAEDLTRVGVQFSQQLEALLSAHDTVLLEDPLTLLPGLSLGARSRPIDSGCLINAALIHSDYLRQTPTALTLCCEVPCTRVEEHEVSQQRTTLTEPQANTSVANRSADDLTTSNRSPNNQAPPSHYPTHLLLGHTAIPISAAAGLPAGVTLTREGSMVSITGDIPVDLCVNDQPAKPGQVLSAGDVLSDALGLCATLIYVEP